MFPFSLHSNHFELEPSHSVGPLAFNLLKEFPSKIDVLPEVLSMGLRPSRSYKLRAVSSIDHKCFGVCKSLSLYHLSRGRDGSQGNNSCVKRLSFATTTDPASGISINVCFDLR
jgi:hypothetical protein